MTGMHGETEKEQEGGKRVRPGGADGGLEGVSWEI